MAISLGDAVVTFKADLTDLNKSIGDATRNMKKEMGNIMSAAATAGKAFTVMGGAAVGGLTAMVVSTANAGDEIFDMSKKTGMSTEAVSKWAFALKQSGGDISTLQTAVRGMSNLIDGARQGTASAVETLARLGFTVQDFAGLSPEQAFQKLSMAVAAIPDPMTRAAIAQDVFGKSGMAMLPALAEGEAGLRGMFDEAQRAGAVFSEAEAAMGDQFNDALGSLTAALQGVSKEIAAILTPTMVGIINYVKDAVIAVKEWTAAHPVLMEWIVKIGAVLGGLMFVLGPLLLVLPGIVAAWTIFGAALAPMAGIITPVAVAIGIGLVAAFFALKAVMEGARSWVNDNWAQITRIFETSKQIILNVLAAMGNVMKAGFTVIGAILSGFGVGVSSAWADTVGSTEEGSTSFLDVLEKVSVFIAEWSGKAAEWLGKFATWIGEHWDDIVKTTSWAVENIVKPLFYLADVFVETFRIVTMAASGIWSAIQMVASFLGIGGGPAPGAGPVDAMAEGGIAQGGLTLVGERGPELVNMPRGARVYPADETRDMLSGGGSVSVQFGGINISGVNDPDKIAAIVARKIEERTQNVFAKRGMRLATT